MSNKANILRRATEKTVIAEVEPPSSVLSDHPLIRSDNRHFYGQANTRNAQLITQSVHLSPCTSRETLSARPGVDFAHRPVRPQRVAEDVWSASLDNFVPKRHCLTMLEGSANEHCVAAAVKQTEKKAVFCLN
jgi:hypothetical protein